MPSVRGLTAVLAALALAGCTESDPASELATTRPGTSTAQVDTGTTPEVLFPDDFDATAIQDLLGDAAAHPKRVRELTPEGREALALIRRYASEGVRPTEYDAVLDAIVRAQCELQLFRELIAELRKQGDPSWKTLCSVAGSYLLTSRPARSLSAPLRGTDSGRAQRAAPRSSRWGALAG